LDWLTNILKPIENLLSYIIEFFYAWIPSYGLGIIMLTILVRIVLLPLTISQTRSMARMQMLQPELQEIQKKYKDDPQRMQQEVMSFYKKNNVNPLSGCLPLILQMPVFFALFQLLRDLGVKAIGAGAQTIYNFLWMDLRRPDPYYILVILMVTTMILTSKMTQTDPKQKLITYIMPVVFGFISFKLQSGILVYWVTTNIWSIGQQWFVNKWVRREKEKAQEKKKAIEKQEKQEKKTGQQLQPKAKKRRRKK
jgi:YidC/Oxa1 family membrane protein insertase